MYTRMMEAMGQFNASEREALNGKEKIRHDAYEKAWRLFDENAIQEESFSDTYEKETIQHHIEAVKALEGKFREQSQLPHENNPTHKNEEVKHYGDILEAIVFDMIKRCEWFGNGVRPVKTSKFDDYKNGVDILVDLEHSRKPLALAIDVTFGFKGMQKKVADIISKIDEGKLSFVRYYRSEDGSFEGKVNNIARVVVGVEMDAVQKMAEYWIRNEDQKLRDHYAQTLILSEIAIQLREYARYARRKGNNHAAQVYEADLEKIETILAEKPDEHMENYDRVYDCITRVVKDMSRG